MLALLALLRGLRRREEMVLLLLRLAYLHSTRWGIYLLTVRRQYPHYLPVWEDQTFQPLQPFEHYDHGKDADPTFPNLLKDGVQQKKLTPKFGSEIRGIQLSSLTKEGKDELALFVAQRGVVAFRDQDFADLPIKNALEFGEYFGRHHIRKNYNSLLPVTVLTSL
jgi:hypothetical protein